VLGADDQDEAALAGGDLVHPHVERGRARGAGVLDPGGALEAQGRIGRKGEGGGEALLLEAAEVADIDGVDVLEADAGVLDRTARRRRHHAFEV
jgi:hypothetical protein